jgi:Zn-dependent M16 (insulinase) family peptidase
MKALHGKVIGGEKQAMLVAEAAEEAKLLDALQQTWGASASGKPGNFGLPSIRARALEGWLTSTQVNFCALAFPTVPSGHPDSAGLSVLGGFLRNGFLHRTIREQGGAYGGGASYDSGSASFRFYSYRDPRLTETLEDFRRAIDWMLTTPHEYAALEEAILGVISSLDKPASPAGTAKQAFHNELFGRDKAQRARFRQHVLNVSVEQLVDITGRYLGDPAKASIGVVSSKTHQADLEKLGLDIHTL